MTGDSGPPNRSRESRRNAKIPVEASGTNGAPRRTKPTWRNHYGDLLPRTLRLSPLSGLETDLWDFDSRAQGFRQLRYKLELNRANRLRLARAFRHDRRVDYSMDCFVEG